MLRAEDPRRQDEQCTQYPFPRHAGFAGKETRLSRLALDTRLGLQVPEAARRTFRLEVESLFEVNMNPAQGQDKLGLFGKSFAREDSGR